MLLKRHCSSVELLPHDVVELILERLPVKSLLRFKSVSNKWQSTIESKRFQERHSVRRRQSRGPDVLFMTRHVTDQVRIVFGSSIVCTVRFPTSSSMACYGSCDGLVCLYCVYTDSIVINPTTRWHQSFPHSRVQEVMAERYRKDEYDFIRPKLGFGKDIFKGTYKPRRRTRAQSLEDKEGTDIEKIAILLNQTEEDCIQQLTQLEAKDQSLEDKETSLTVDSCTQIFFEHGMWTVAKNERLYDLWKNGMNPEKICLLLNCSVVACSQRLSELRTSHIKQNC